MAFLLLGLVMNPLIYLLWSHDTFNLMLVPLMLVFAYSQLTQGAWRREYGEHQKREARMKAEMENW